MKLPDDDREVCCRRNLPSEEKLLHLLELAAIVAEDVLSDHGDPEPNTNYVADDVRAVARILRLAERILTSAFLRVESVHPTKHLRPSVN